MNLCFFAFKIASVKNIFIFRKPLFHIILLESRLFLLLDFLLFDLFLIFPGLLIGLHNLGNFFLHGRIRINRILALFLRQPSKDNPKRHIKALCKNMLQLLLQLLHLHLRNAVFFHLQLQNKGFKKCFLCLSEKIGRNLSFFFQFINQTSSIRLQQSRRRILPRQVIFFNQADIYLVLKHLAANSPLRLPDCLMGNQSIAVDIDLDPGMISAGRHLFTFHSFKQLSHFMTEL